MNRATHLALEIFMTVVLLTAVGVGSATLIGSILGFLLGGLAEKYASQLMAFSSGVMLACSFDSLIIPALATGESVYIICLSVLFGGAIILLFDKLARKISPTASHDGRRVLLFVLAMGLHNLPEGIASGVGFGLSDIGAALSIALSVAVQNIPEGMVIIAPLLSLGIGRLKTFLIAFVTGAIEVVGTLLGYFFVSGDTALISPLLAMAGGTMIYVIYDEASGKKVENTGASSLLFLVGCVGMLAFSALI
jgi:ZIP family zinc transporter